MISFIVIGRNEEKNIKLCLTSIFNTIKFNNFKKYEVIYVDSNSSDCTIKIVKQFEDVKIIKIINIYNAAIARNLGANNTKGDLFFYIDGDMELNPKFLSYVYNNHRGLIDDFVTGSVIDVYLEKDLPFKNVKKVLRDEDSYAFGGIF